MNTISIKNRFVLVLALIIGLTTACKKNEDDPQPTVVSEPAFRKTPVKYSTLTPTTSYRGTFFDEDGDSTVNRNDGRARLRMFRGLFAYIGTAVSGNVTLDSAKMSNMFANKNAAFDGIYADLNVLDMSIKEATAASKSNQADVYHDLEVAFGRMAYISQFTAQTASKGTPGKNGNYLVDANGIEWAQIIQKTLIGGYHLDYIGNVLLNTGLDATNHQLVTGKRYTQLEHNWDEAYGFLSFNDIYGINATARDAMPARSNEFYLGSYVWEYNAAGFEKLHSAFLKGRAAIHNNDMNEVRVQAKIIRKVLETAIGGAAKGYMGKASDAVATENLRVHAFGEGKGFVYSTRFCKLTGCDDAYSEDLEDDLIPSESTTFYDITAAQFTTVGNKLKATFKLQ